MADATLPPIQPSVDESAAPAEPQSSPTETPQQESSPRATTDAYPLLVHSQDSVASGEPAAVDNGKSASAKRKRTSPEDQAVLEAEYKANPKPDKAARLEIVKKVSLGEKAVQIWFQNRRQNTRRKSRPLLPHEIAAFGLGGMAALSSSPNSIFGSSQPGAIYPSSSPSEVSANPEAGAGGLYQQLDAAATSKYEAVAAPPSSSAPAATPSKPKGDDVESGIELALFSASQPQSSSQPILPPPVSTPGYISNRRSASSTYFSNPGRSLAPVHTPNVRLVNSGLPNSAPSGFSTPINGQTPDSATQVRLSYSSDGKATLVPSAHVVSPPRPHAPRPTSANSTASIPARRLGSLQRSQSALPFSHYLSRATSAASPSPAANGVSATPFTPRLMSGRSKDARAWEFCCDAEARDELTTQAENESHGSAIAAISLLRSTSSNALKANHNKRNTPTSSRMEKDGSSKRPKIGRAQSSLACMQGSSRTMAREESDNTEGNDAKRSRDGAKSPGDSDKENWVPSVGGGHRRTQALAKAAREGNKQGIRKRVLGNLGGTTVNGERSKIFPDQPAQPKKIDADVEKFMRGEVSPSKKGDLDCIQGLLSLSQGNWR